MISTLLNIKPVTITSDSRHVVDGSLFLAYPGEHADGRDYINDAINNGAKAVLWDPAQFDWNSTWLVEHAPVAHLKQQVGEIADAFYERPSEQLKMIGVTGTNGKTSVTQWLAQCCNHLATKTAVIGTLGHGLPSQLSPTMNTTPDALLLQAQLADYVKDGIEAVAMEVSSHGIDQGRVNSVRFDIAVLTNLSRDHLDYHGSYEHYAATKKRLFLVDGLAHAVLNSDEAFGREVEVALEARDVNVLTYGIESGDVLARNISMDNGRIQFDVVSPYGQAAVSVNLLGRFNIYNVLAVLSALLVSDVSLDAAAEAVSHIEPLSGRMEKFGGGHLPLVVVDYAHTPDALENVLQSLSDESEGKLICVFGCGGNRDQGKRAMMGTVASEFSDSVVVTSDNPRHEDPDSIIKAVLAGVDGAFAVEADRARAIAVAIESASKGDVVLVAGKGHETYQEIAGEKRYFSDAEQVTQALLHYEAALA